MRFAVCRCLRWLVRSSSRIRSMIPVNGPSFGRLGGLRFGDTLAAPRTTASYGPSCGLHQTPARPRGCSSPRHDTPAEPVRTTPPDTSPPPSSQSNPDRRLYAVPFWSAAAGSTGRFSGGLLLCRSHPGSDVIRRTCGDHRRGGDTPAGLAGRLDQVGDDEDAAGRKRARDIGEQRRLARSVEMVDGERRNDTGQGPGKGAPVAGGEVELGGVEAIAELRQPRARMRQHLGEPSKAWTVAFGRRSSSAWLNRPSPQHNSTTCDGGGVSGIRLQIVSICCSRSGT